MKRLRNQQLKGFLGLLVAVCLLIFAFVGKVSASFGIRPLPGTLTGYVYEDRQAPWGTMNLPLDVNLHRTDGTYTITYTGPTSGTLMTNGSLAPANNITPVSVPAGTYTVTFTLGSSVYTGITMTSPAPPAPYQKTVVVPAGGTGTVSFGGRPHHLKGFVWVDDDGDATWEINDGNGVVNASEFAKAGVNLVGSCLGIPLCAEATTDASPATPNYDILHKGPLTAWGPQMPSPSQEWVQTVPPGTVPVPAIAANAEYIANFGIRHTPVVEGRVCDDQNQNGTCDVGEPNVGDALNPVELRFHPDPASPTSCPEPDGCVISAPSTHTPTCAECNYTTTDLVDTYPLFPGDHQLEILVPTGWALTGGKNSIRPLLLNSAQMIPWQEDFPLTPSTPGSTISGYVWDDVNHNRLYDPGEDKITSAAFNVALFDGAGVSIGNMAPNPVDGSFTFPSTPPAGNYELRLGTASGYCIGNVGDETGWNEVNSTTHVYTTTSSPYETGEVIDVTSGAADINLGSLTDFISTQAPSGDVDLTPGECTTITYTVAPNPCWVDELVDVEFVPDPTWPSGLTTKNPTPSNPATLNPHDENNQTMTLEVCADKDLPPGTYDFDLNSDSTGGPVRDKVLSQSVVIGVRKWVLVNDSDVYSAFDNGGLGDGINFILPQSPTHWLVEASASTWGGVALGGLPLAKSGITVLRAGSGEVGINERDWNMPDYEGTYDVPFTTADFSGVAECQNMESLPAGGACFYDKQTLSGNYALDNPGISVLYVPNDVEITGGFVNSSSDPGRVILVVNGNITIKCNNCSVQAEIVTLGGHDLIIEDERSTFVVNGAVITSGAVDNRRTLSGGEPSMIVNPDPYYFQYPVFGVSSNRIIWRDVVK